jgi:hypothetical protein
MSLTKQRRLLRLRTGKCPRQRTPSRHMRKQALAFLSPPVVIVRRFWSRLTKRASTGWWWQRGEDNKEEDPLCIKWGMMLFFNKGGAIIIVAAFGMGPAPPSVIGHGIMAGNTAC